MVDNEKNQFKALLDHVMDIYEKPRLDKAVLITWWNVLVNYDFKLVTDAFNHHLRNSKFSPKPADIIENINAMHSDGRPSDDEAWAMIPHDESKSVVMSDEMAEAMAIAKPLIDAVDYIAARMAFKQAYKRIVDANKMKGIAPKWSPSLGHSPEGREQALKEAVRLGRIAESHAAALLPAPVHSSITKAIGDIKMLSSTDELTDEQKALNHERIQNIKRLLVKAA